jgi:hypothetical protein
MHRSLSLPYAKNILHVGINSYPRVKSIKSELSKLPEEIFLMVLSRDFMCMKNNLEARLTSYRKTATRRKKSVSGMSILLRVIELWKKEDSYLVVFEAVE